MTRNRSLEVQPFEVSPRVLSVFPVAALCLFGWSQRSDAPAEPPRVEPMPVIPAPPPFMANPIQVALTSVTQSVAWKQPARTASTLPATARAAYERAATLVNAADRDCHLDWTLVAAIGEVETDHGRRRPAKAAAPTPDTDAGRWDRKRTYDRPVGPMQIQPATWTRIAVDADGDGRRDPRDLDDAALAVTVQLCSTDQDLATQPGRRTAVLSLRSSTAYVDLVGRVMRAYARARAEQPPRGFRTILIEDPPEVGKADMHGKAARGVSSRRGRR